MKRSGAGLAGLAVLGLSVLAAAAEGPTDYAAILAPKDRREGLVESIRDTRTFPYIDRALRLIAAGDLAAARKDLEIYLDRVPSDAEARFRYGVLLSALGEPAEAAKAMTTVLSAHPGFGPAHLYRGLARQERDDRVGALSDFEAASRSDVLTQKDHDFALESVADVAAELGEYDEAKRALLALAKASPEDPTWLDRLGVIAERQGDDRAALGYRSRAVALDATSARQRALAVAAERVGETGAAVQAAAAAVSDDEESDSHGRLAADLERLAVLQSKDGSSREAGENFERAYREGSKRAPDLLVRAARMYAAAGEADRARRLYREVGQDESAPEALRVDAFTSLADLEARSGRAAAERETLRSLVAIEGPTWRTLQALGDLDLRSGRAPEALAAYGRALRLRDEPRTRLAMGYAFQQMGKPGLAVYEIDRALKGDLSRAQRVSALRTLGFLHADARRYGAAATAWSEAEALEPDRTLTLSLARVERLSGRSLAAARTLDRVDPETLSSADRALYWTERSALARSRDDEEVAVRDLRRALSIEPNPEREAGLGILLARAGDDDEARALFARALETGAGEAETSAALGHVDLDLGDPAAAIGAFERALAADPDMLSLYEDLGYTYLREVRNDEAVARFEQAIDNEPFYPAATEEDRRENALRTERLRREITEVDRWISLVGYTSICFGGDNCRIDQTALIEGASESQGGAELSLRPPVIGFRHGRIFEVISRVLYQQEVNSIEPIGSSLVATLGARYKPLETQDLYLSVERIFGVGSDATDNTLLRGSYGWLHGYRLRPGEPSWTYATLYLDLSYTAEPPRNWFAYVEGRVGRSFNYDDRALLTPLLYLRNRNLTGEGDDFYDVDVGAGVSLRWLWNDDRYHDYRSVLELLPRVGYDAYNSDGRGWNIFLTGVMQF